MTAADYIAIYAGLILFLAGCLRRIWQYSRTTLHLRWELYPLPHEDPYRAAYGGSYFETQEWWRKRQVVNRRGEWRVMVEEIVFLKSLRTFNRRLWIPSFLFHFGMYLAISAIGLMILQVVAGGLGSGKGNSAIAAVLVSVASVAGLAGAVLIVAGACMLLVRRASDRAFRNSTKVGDIFNLFFFIAVFGLLAGGYLARGPGAASLSEFARGMVHFDRGVKVDAVFGMGAILASGLIAYIPFTHMAHFIAKYFTWHAVRWDDRRNERGSGIERKMAVNLGYKPTWCGPHVGADGQRSWAEIATTPPEQVKK